MRKPEARSQRASNRRLGWSWVSSAGVVRALDVDGLAGEGAEAGDGRKGLRNPDLLHLLPGLEEREQLLVLRVEGEDRHSLGLDEVEHPVLDVHQDFLDARGGVDQVRDLDELLAVGELALGGIGRDCHGGLLLLLGAASGAGAA